MNRKHLHLLIYKELNEKDEFRMLAIFKNEKGELSIFIWWQFVMALLLKLIRVFLNKATLEFVFILSYRVYIG